MVDVEVANSAARPNGDAWEFVVEPITARELGYKGTTWLVRKDLRSFSTAKCRVFGGTVQSVRRRALTYVCQTWSGGTGSYSGGGRPPFVEVITARPQLADQVGTVLFWRAVSARFFPFKRRNGFHLQ